MCSIALKEWVAAVEAVKVGKQIVLLRKGGIREEQPLFDMKSEGFFLWPSYWHLEAGSIKPQYTKYVPDDSEVEYDEGVATLSVFAEAAAVHEISTEKELASLAPFHIWTDEFVTTRLKWRPSQPISAIVVKAYRLQQPQALMVMDEYKGCKSWVEFIEEYPVGTAEQVITERRFVRRLEAIRSALMEARA